MLEALLNRLYEEQTRALNSDSITGFKSALKWHSPSARNRTPNPLFDRHITHTILPQWLQNFEANRFRIAGLLTLIDSRKIPTEYRVQIGLPEVPEYSARHGISNYPLLADPRIIGTGELCGNAESFFKGTQVRLETGSDYRNNPRTVPFELSGCLAVKTDGIFSGICFETTEFPNGSVFLKDVWYVLLGRHSTPETYDGLIDCRIRATQPQQYTEGDYANLYADNGVDPIITPSLVVWRNAGGTWAPARELNQHNASVVRRDYTSDCD